MATGTSWGAVASGIAVQPLLGRAFLYRFGWPAATEFGADEVPGIATFSGRAALRDSSASRAARKPTKSPPGSSRAREPRVHAGSEVVEVPARLAARLAARVDLLGLLEALARGGLVALELQSDPLAEQRSGVAAVHGERFLEFGSRLLQLAVGEEGAARRDVLIRVGNELHVEHRLAHHVPEHEAQRPQPPQRRHLRRGHHRDGQFRDLLSAKDPKSV